MRMSAVRRFFSLPAPFFSHEKMQSFLALANFLPLSPLAKATKPQKEKTSIIISCTHTHKQQFLSFGGRPITTQGQRRPVNIQQQQPEPGIGEPRIK
jgi:hypothetical protein